MILTLICIIVAIVLILIGITEHIAVINIAGGVIITICILLIISSNLSIDIYNGQLNNLKLERDKIMKKEDNS